MSPVQASELPRMSFEEYLEREQQSATKHEFLDGLVYAMAGSTIDHSTITVNVVTELNIGLRGRSCRVVSNDVLVVTPAAANGFYPDVSVVCNAEIRGAQRILDLPTLVVEVLSPGTRRYDLTIKLARYKLIPALRAILFLESTRREAQLFAREPLSTWPAEPQTFTGEDAEVPLEALGITLPLSAIYFNIAFDTL
jgi:Uma2 family endonuclease